MHSTIEITCDITNSDTAVPLGIEIWLDNQQIFNQDQVTETVPFCYKLSDDDAEHKLCFVMKNKTVDHTQLDSVENIVKDAWLSIDNLAFDEIQLGHRFVELATYTHDFNGTGKQTQEKFFGTMGCNGTVSLEFKTPIYLWLLEHM